MTSIVLCVLSAGSVHPAPGLSSASETKCVRPSPTCRHLWWQGWGTLTWLSLPGRLLLPVIIALLYAFPHKVLRNEASNQGRIWPSLFSNHMLYKYEHYSVHFLIQITKQRRFVMKLVLSEKKQVLWLMCRFCDLLQTICPANKENNRFFYHWSETWWSFEKNLMFRDLFIILWTYVWRTAYGNQSIVHKEL